MLDRRTFACLSLASFVPSRAEATSPTSQAIERAAEASLGSQAAGIALAALGGEVLWSGPVGRPPERQAARRSTVFDALSIGKFFTSVALMRLVDLGRLDLNAAIKTYLPELPASFDGLKVRHALNNDTGLPVYLEGDDLLPRTAEQALAEIAAAAPDRGPGTGYRYSNVSYQLLGLMIERITGSSYEEAVRALVLDPVGLSSTDVFSSPRWRSADVASGWIDRDNRGSPARWPNTWSLLGAAGWATTIDDLFRLNRAVTAGPFLSPLTRQRMFTGGAPTYGRRPIGGSGMYEITYGCGMFHWLDGQGRRVHFSGGAGDFGFHAMTLWRENDDVYVAAMLNTQRSGVEIDRAAFFDAILALLSAS